MTDSPQSSTLGRGAETHLCTGAPGMPLPAAGTRTALRSSVSVRRHSSSWDSLSTSSSDLSDTRGNHSERTGRMSAFSFCGTFHRCTCFANDLLQVLVQVLLPLSEHVQPVRPQPLQVRLLRTRTRSYSVTAGGHASCFLLVDALTW